MALAAMGLLGLRGRAQRLVAPAQALKRLHAGLVGDYIAWLRVGIAAYGGIWALLLR